MPLSTKPRPKPAAHHKKRQAEHHKKGKQYIKSYWPYLPMLLIVGLGLGLNSIWSGQAVLGASSDFSAPSLLTSTNQQRLAAHESALTIDPKLTAAAQAKAADMVARNYWSHTTPDGQAPWTFVSAAGYNYNLAGENLAYGFNDANQTVTGWMNSPEHKANILNAGYNNVGFGVVSTPDFLGRGPRIIVVALYGQASTSVANISFEVANHGQSPRVLGQASDREPNTQPVSRLQLIHDGQPTWTTLVVSLLGLAALATFLIRHGLHLHRVLVHGEFFIAHHPVLDITIVTLATIGFVLTRTGGIIR